MGSPEQQKRAGQPLMVQGFVLEGEQHTVKQWVTADVVVIANRGAIHQEVVALLRRIADELEQDPIPDELHGRGR